LAKYLDVMLHRTKAYNPSGRYETEAQAREIDAAVDTYLTTQLKEFPLYFETTMIDLLARGVQEML